MNNFINSFVLHLKVLFVSMVSVLPLAPKIVPTSTPSPQPSPTVIVSPTPSLPIAKITSNIRPTLKPTYDGTRTGAIIDYKELCTGKQIKIYTNEQIQYTDRAGVKRLLTAEDIHCLVSEDSLSAFREPYPDGFLGAKFEEAEIRTHRCVDIINQYYDWKYPRCKNDISCQKVVDAEKSILLDQCGYGKQPSWITR